MNDKQDEIDERRELDDKYFERFDDLNEARPIFKGIDEAFLCFAQNILNDYKTERLILEKKMRIKEKRELYKLDIKSDALLPQTWRNWKKFFRREQNLAKTLLDEEVERDTKQFFENCLKRLGERKTEEREVSEQATDRAEEQPIESVQGSVPVTRVEGQQLITVYVAGNIPPFFTEIEPGADQPFCDTQESEKPAEEAQQEGDVEIQVEKFDDYGIDTEYTIVEDGEEVPENSEEEPADKPENELVTDKATEAPQTPEPGADELSKGVQEGEPIEEESND